LSLGPFAVFTLSLEALSPACFELALVAFALRIAEVCALLVRGFAAVGRDVARADSAAAGVFGQGARRSCVARGLLLPAIDHAHRSRVDFDVPRAAAAAQGE
jgi:hypothetical protein